MMMLTHLKLKLYVGSSDIIHTVSIAMAVFIITEVAILYYWILGATYACCAYYGQGTGSIHFRYLNCNGLEHRLTDCQYSTNTPRRRHYDDWSVLCYTGGFTSVHCTL